ncbi:hypothetical protein IFM89_005128 [Coptis chinensis]|uniref:Uncharacterized protein n=1 Tax=Coptis chinensis TaxID=261450 RepID=A0A835IKZ6_9MAGN|nr:hypothetical protein IFM89_005128 [Coptis chinensis]
MASLSSLMKRTLPSGSKSKVHPHPLIEAARVGNLKRIKKLGKELDDGWGLSKTIGSIKDDYGGGLLHHAAAHGMTHICKKGVAWATLKKFNLAANAFSEGLRRDPEDKELQIALRNKIYVFGGAQPDKLLLQPGLAYWGECYDIATNIWVYLTPPTRELGITSYALVKNSSQILFYLPHPEVITIYDLDHNLWLSDPGHPAPYMFPWWSDRVVVLADSFLIWSYAGTIYAYDLHKKQLLPPFEELGAPDLKTIPERYPECHGSPKHTLLEMGYWLLFG